VKELRQRWVADFEYQPTGLHNEYNRVMPVCFVATEIHSGRQVRVKQDELLTMSTWPINVGEDAVFICYSAGAEGSCAAVLGWPMPHNILDLYAERLLRLNREGKRWRGRTSLLKTLEHYRLPAMGAEKKELLRHKILTRLAETLQPWEREEILEYCAEDALALKLLLSAMENEQPINLAQAFWRGRWMFASGMIEQVGIPVDPTVYSALHSQRLMLRRLLIARQDRWGIHENGVRKHKNIVAQLRKWQVPIERFTDSGVPALNQKTYKMMARRDKRVEEMRAFLNLLDQLRDINLTLGDDSRNRFWSRPLLSITARNQPSTTENILSYPKWLRGLITPPEGFAIVVIDYSNQETLISAGQSGDTALAETCEGDRHLQVAIALGFAPEGATKDSHPAERNRAKPLNHGSAYGVSAWGISEQLGCSLREAQQMIDEYDRTFHIFRAWQTRLVERALLFGRITAPTGWSMRVTERTSVRTLMNWMLQTLGAQMTQAAAVLLIREGYTVCATAHDSVMLLVPLADLEARVARAQRLMAQVSLSFTKGLRVPTSADVVRPGKRLLDRETRPMWNLVMRALGLPEDHPEEVKMAPVVAEV
jgi:DNA polymerase-1